MNVRLDEALDAMYDVAANEVGVAPAVVRRGTRQMRVIRARHAVWYVASKRLAATVVAIGAPDGYEHSTVINGINRVRLRLTAHDDDMRDMVRVLNMRLDILERRPDEASRLAETLALLDTAEKLAPVIEALGHALASMGRRLTETVDDVRLSLEAAERIRSGAA